MEKIKTLVYLSSNQSLVTSTNQEFIEKCERKLSCEQFAEEYVNGLNLDNTLVRVIKTYNDEDYVCCTNAEDVKDGVFELCPCCDEEVFLKEDFSKQVCPNCGKPILPCSQCEDRDCGNCPLKMKLYEVTINYRGSITQRVLANTEDDAYEKVSSKVRRMSNDEFLTELEPQEIDHNVTPID